MFAQPATVAQSSVSCNAACRRNNKIFNGTPRPPNRHPSYLTYNSILMRKGLQTMSGMLRQYVHLAPALFSLHVPDFQFHIYCYSVILSVGKGLTVLCSKT